MFSASLDARRWKTGQPSLDAVRELFGEIIHASFHGSILIHHVLYGFASVDDGPMIPAPEGISYFLKGMIGQDAAQIHRDLTGKGYVVGSPATDHVGHPQVIVLGDLLLNLLDQGFDLFGLLIEVTGDEFLFI